MCNDQQQYLTIDAFIGSHLHGVRCQLGLPVNCIATVYV